MIRNPLVKRIIIALFIICSVAALVYVALIVIKNNKSLIYDLGEKDDRTYVDTVITSYNDYKKIVKDYKIKQDLKEEAFNESSYVATFQEYDSCSESEYKTVEETSIEDNNITIKFLYHNKCGWCKKHIVLYFIQVEKLDSTDYNINYTYDFGKQAQCGEVK